MRQANVETLPFADGQFDHGIATLVFCSVDDPAAGLAQIRRATKAYRAGATLAGSESGFAMTPYGEWHTRELELFVSRFGMSDVDALLCMTRDAAITLPKHRDEIGTLTPGKYADLLVVDGQPDRDVRVLQDRDKLPLIMQAGRTVEPSRSVNGSRRKQTFERVHTYAPGVYLREHQRAAAVSRRRRAVRASLSGRRAPHASAAKRCTEGLSLLDLPAGWRTGSGPQCSSVPPLRAVASTTPSEPPQTG